MDFRKIVFWTHLVSGVIAGLVIAVMSATGVAIAFEEEILAWVDRDVRRIAPAAPGATPLPFDQLLERAAAEKPGFNVTRIVRVRDEDRAWELFAGREGPVYVNPFTGELRDSQAHATHDLIHE